MKKLIALVICLCLVLTVFAGCGQSQEEPAAEAPAEETAAAETPAPTAEPEAEAPETPAETAEPRGVCLGGSGFDTYPAETVVGTVNGTDVTWMEYYYWLNYYTQYVQQFAAQYGVVLDGWAANDLSGTDTNAQVVIMNAQQDIVQDHAILTETEKMGVQLTEEDEATLQSVIEQNADSVAGDGDGTATEDELTAFDAYLLGELNVDRDFFRHMNIVPLLADAGFVETYGEDGGKMSDEDVLAFAEANGMMAAKHILITTVDTETREPLSDEEIAEKTQRAQDLYDQLQAVADDHDAMVALFDELTAEYTEDTGYEYYPDGYVFVEGQMVQQFEDAVKELEVGELSGIVQSDYGYHIILRIPVDPDAIVGTDANGNNSTLRFAAAYQSYVELMQSWMAAADVQWYEGFQEPDLEAIFG